MRRIAHQIRSLRKRYLLCGTFLLGLTSLLGCSSSMYGWQVRTHSTELPPSLRPSQFEKQPVALFTAITLPALKGNEVSLADYLGDILRKVVPNWRVIPPQETATRINTQGLTPDYAMMREMYETTHILNRDTLRKIGRAIGARYVFQPRLAAFSQTMTERWKFPGLEVRMAETRSSLMRMSLHLWDVDTGELLWTSTAETTMQSEAVSEDPIYLEDIARATLGSIIADFLNRRTSSKYTSLNKFLDSLVKESMPEEKPRKPEAAEQ